MAQGTLKIHTENILPIIKKWLYSDKDIFLRELVSNATDAIQKVKLLREQKLIDAKDEDFRIDIDIKDNTITISDTGIGMTADEVEKYIAQLAFSGAEEFLEKYKSDKEEDQIIGHFGLGFYSAYIVANKVTIDTLSYQEDAKPVFWSCDGSSEYTIDTGSRQERGTTITLHVEEKEFLQETKLKEILNQYCAFLPYPIYLNGTQINAKQPLWLKAPSECTDEEYLEFFRALYPTEPDPIFWVHLNIDYPFHLKGILYFPKISKRFDWQSNSIKLFSNRVFVSDNCKDLIPEYLMILRGALDSTDIPLNVSRSTLQMDATVRKLSSHISKKVADRIANLYINEREKLIEYWPHIELIVKLGAMQDDKFYERIKDALIWKNTSDEWTNIPDYLERNDTKKIFYATDPNNHCLNLYKKQEVLLTATHLDTSFISFLETKIKPATFQRIDGAIDDSILDKDREKSLLDADGKSQSSNIATFFKKLLPEHLTVEAKSLSNDALPAFILIDEQQRRMQEMLALHNPDTNLPQKHTLVVNTNNKLIDQITKCSDPDLASALTSHLYELSLLSQKEFDPSQISTFIDRSHSLLTQLASNLT